MNKKNYLTGLLQALGVGAYCALVAGLFWSLQKFLGTPPAFWGTVFMLILLVFSVAIVGSLIFGYPAYLALHNRFRDGLFLVASTLVWILIIISLIALILILAR